MRSGSRDTPRGVSFEAAAERDEDGDEKGKLKTWGKRAGYVGRGLIYASLTFSAVKILFGASRQPVTEREGAPDHRDAVSAGPAGRWLVGAAGHRDRRGRALERLPRSQ